MTVEIDLSTALWIYWSTILSMTAGLLLLRAHRVWSGANYWIAGNLLALCNLPLLAVLYEQGVTSSTGLLPATLIITDSVLKVVSVSERALRTRNVTIGLGILTAYLFGCSVLLDASQGALVIGLAGILVGLLAIWQGWLILHSNQLARLHGSNLLVVASFMLAAFMIGMSLYSLQLGHQQVLFERSDQVGLGCAVIVNLMILRHICLIAMMMAMLNRKLAAGRIRHRKQISLRKQAEVHAARMADLVKEKQSLLEVLTHEVRQPLNNAQAALQDFLMNRQGNSHDLTSGARLQVILDQIGLTLSNAIVGANLLERRAQSVLAPTDIVVVCQLACSDAGPDWEERIELVAPEEPIVAPADPILLRLALRNLLENAARHSPPDRKVTMTLKMGNPPGSLTISVTNWPIDTFAADNRLFERGVRGEAPIGEGEGLGLHIVKEVTLLHHGVISARVRPDRHTEFALSIPLVENLATRNG